MFKRILLYLSLLSLLSASFANEKYSFEKAESLKPLIDRRDYSPSSFQEAQQDKKPIFMLLTAPSWCYRCQVYESEEYLFDPEIIELLNTKTIPVYVDADIRQDLTRKYLEWWWPSTTVMTPDGSRIYWYSGPRPIANMKQNIENAWSHVQTLWTWWILPEVYRTSSVPELSEQSLTNIQNNVSQVAVSWFDKQYGGFWTSKKFPQWRILKYFVDQYNLTKESNRIEMVQLTLEQQYTSPQELSTNYNLYDPIEWWFHRYWTTRNRDPPHYEKMLYDNVRLLDAYHNYWRTWLDDPYVNEVLAWTWKYLINDYYDSKNWWFFANTDVNWEAAYYAQNPRPLPKARVEETKYTDRNADALVSLLSIRSRQDIDMQFQTPTWQYTVTLNQLDKIIIDTLHFLDKEIMTKQWAYHYQQPDGNTWVRWSIIDQWLLALAYIHAYEIYGTNSYLKSARSLVDYSLENLYDWYGWWFFERNSPDRHLYALNDFVDLSKPIAENGIFAYALTKLTILTQDKNYHIAAHDTLAWMSSQARQWWLDKWYYNMIWAKAFQDAWLLETLPSNIQLIRDKRQATSRLNGYIDGSAYRNTFALSWVWLESYTHRWFWPFALLAFLAGMLSFLSPCTLPVLPAYVANILRNKTWSNRKNIIWFMIWLIWIFTILWLSATGIWKFFHGSIEILVPLIWIVLIIFWLLLMLGENFSWFTQRIPSYAPSSSSSILLGASMWITWTPCVWPILLSILAVAWLQSQIRQGATLLVLYGLWLALPLLIVGFFYERIQHLKRWFRLAWKPVQFAGQTIHSNTLIAWWLLLWVWLLIVFGGLDIIAMRWTKAFGNSRLGELERTLLQ